MVASVVVISGTPGTGKTSVAEKIKVAGYLTLDLFEFAKKYGCLEGKDEKRDSIIVNTEKLSEVLEEYLSAGYGIIVIEGHYTDIIPEQFVSRAYVLSAKVMDLQRRLNLRNYTEEKIEENIQAEIMQVCWTEALEAFGQNRVIKLEPTSIEEEVEIILDYLKIL